MDSSSPKSQTREFKAKTQPLIDGDFQSVPGSTFHFSVLLLVSQKADIYSIPSTGFLGLWFPDVVLRSLSQCYYYCGPVDYSMPSSPVLHCLLEFPQVSPLSQ